MLHFIVKILILHFRLRTLLKRKSYYIATRSIFKKWNILIFLLGNLMLPCTFRGVSSLTAVAHTPYIANILTPYQIKAYKICNKKIAIVFDSNESVSFLRPIYEDVMIAFREL